MAKDNFDDLIESEIRDASRPKPTPPSGVVGTTNYRNESQTSRPRVRLAAPTKSRAAEMFFVIGVVSGVAALVLTVVTAALVGFGAAAATASSGAVSALFCFGASVAIEHLHAVAHWTQQTAEAVRQAEESRHQGTASKKD